MHLVKKYLSIFLTILILFSVIAPAGAFSLRIDPVKNIYESGEKVTVTADVYGGFQSFNWFLAGTEKEETALTEKDKSINLQLPENNTGQTVSAVVYAEHEGERQFLNIAIASQEEEELKIIEWYPEPGAKGVDCNVEPYVIFNKPVELVESDTYFVFRKKNQVGKYKPFPTDYKVNKIIVDEYDPHKVVFKIQEKPLPANGEYAIGIRRGTLKVVDGDETNLNYYYMDWTFDTMTQIVGPIPHSIEIKDFPDRLSVGKSYPLKAEIKDKDGERLHKHKVVWEIDNISALAAAEVDENGYLVGKKPGFINLIAYPEGFSNLAVKERVEIRQNFSQQLSIEWSQPMDKKSIRDALVARDGSIYIINKVGAHYKVYGLDAKGEKKEDFTTITDLTRMPVLAQIKDEEYLIAPRDKKLLAFDLQTGASCWESEELPWEIKVSPQVGPEGNIYTGTSDDGLIYAFSLEQTYPLWSYHVEYLESQDNRENPLNIGPDGYLYIPSKDNLYIIDKQGDLQGRFITKDQRDILSRVAIDEEGTAYFYDQKITIKNYTERWYEAYFYAVRADGSLKWLSPKYEGKFMPLSGKPFIDTDGGLVFCINEMLTKLDRQTGEIIKQYPYKYIDFVITEDDYLYTDKAIYNQAREAVAYADDYYQNLPYIGYTWGDPTLDGARLRFLTSGSNAVALQKVRLYDIGEATPHSIEVNIEELIIYQGGKHSLEALVKDVQGVPLLIYGVQYVSKDAQIAEVDELGNITPHNIGETEITVTVVGYEDISKTIKVQVKEQPVLKEIYFATYIPKEKNIENVQRIEKITGFVGEELPNAQLCAVDTDGNVVRDLTVSWDLADGSIVNMYNYSGGVMGSVSKSTLVLNGLKTGKTRVTASVAGYPDIPAAVLEVEVEPAAYETLWTLPIEGAWDHKFAYHAQDKEGNIFLTNYNKLKFITPSGEIKKVLDIGAVYGIRPSTPVVDEGGHIYLYDEMVGTTILALDAQEGDVLWVFDDGGEAIADIRITATDIYGLTVGGNLYKLDKNGQKLWQVPLNIGRNNTGIAVNSEGQIYFARGRDIYTISEDKNEELFYRSEDASVLRIKEITSDNRLIVEKEGANVYSIISLTKQGKEEWQQEVAGPTELASDERGRIYIVERKIYEPHVYCMERNGEIKFAEIIPTAHFSSPYDYHCYYKPVLGPDGTLYVSITRLYTLNPETGKLFWQAEFKDGFFKRPPRTITVDENNVIYVACDDAGFKAIKGKKLLDTNQEVSLSVLGSRVLKKDDLKNLTINLINNKEEAKYYSVLLTLIDLDADKVVNYTSFADSLLPRGSQNYECGINVPYAGNYQVRVQVLGENKQVIEEKILPVQ